MMSHSEYGKGNFKKKSDLIASRSIFRNPQPYPDVVPSAVAPSAVTAMGEEIHNDSTSIVIPDPNDVLFGKGNNQNPGNKKLNELLDHFESAYESVSKKRKMEYTCVVVCSMMGVGSRFLKYNFEKKRWHVVPYMQAHEKVSKGFRNRRRGKR
jgi:hypothetical protein